MSETSKLRTRLRARLESRKRMAKGKAKIFGIAATMFKGVKAGDAAKAYGLPKPKYPNLTGLHGAIKADSRYNRPSPMKKPMTPKQAAALRKAQKAAAIANRRRGPR